MVITIRIVFYTYLSDFLCDFKLLPCRKKGFAGHIYTLRFFKLNWGLLIIRPLLSAVMPRRLCSVYPGHLVPKALHLAGAKSYHLWMVIDMVDAYQKISHLMKGVIEPTMEM